MSVRLKDSHGFGFVVKPHAGERRPGRQGRRAIMGMEAASMLGRRLSGTPSAGGRPSSTANGGPAGPPIKSHVQALCYDRSRGGWHVRSLSPPHSHLYYQITDYLW